MHIDWGHPLASGLAVCFLHREGTGTSTYDLVDNGAVPGTFVNGPTWSARGVEFSGSAYIDVPRADAPFLAAAGLTLLWCGVIDSGGTYRHFVGKHAGGGGTDNPFDFRTNDGTPLSMALVRANPSGVRDWLGSQVPTGAHITVAVTCPDNLVTSTPTFYLNGTGEAGGTAGGAGTGAVTGSEANIVIGRRADGFLQMVGACEYLMMWSRALSGTEISALFADPFAFVVFEEAASGIERLNIYSPRGTSQPVARGWA